MARPPAFRLHGWPARWNTKPASRRVRLQLVTQHFEGSFRQWHNPHRARRLSRAELRYPDAEVDELPIDDDLPLEPPDPVFRESEELTLTQPCQRGEQHRASQRRHDRPRERLDLGDGQRLVHHPFAAREAHTVAGRLRDKPVVEG